jgi:hypothetical protein
LAGPLETALIARYPRFSRRFSASECEEIAQSTDLPDRVEWQAAVDRLLGQGLRPVASFNPYWDNHGKTFADPDGYRVVLQNAAWPA